MHAYELRCEMLVRRPIREVFSVFENPYNLLSITPQSLNLRVISKERVVMREGAEIEYRIRWMGIPISWKTLITAYDPPYSFIDEAVEGPYAFWRHHHIFMEQAEGTLVTDLVDYALPFGLLGHLVHRLVVRRQLRQIFAFRQKALGRILGRAEPLADAFTDPIIVEK